MTVVRLSGSGAWRVPPGVTEVYAECYGFGGGGLSYNTAIANGAIAGTGGGGGGYSAGSLAVTAGDLIPYQCIHASTVYFSRIDAAPGSDGNAGGGGAGGDRGNGDIAFVGGRGAAAPDGTHGGGGGGAAGPGGDGGNASGSTPGAAGGGLAGAGGAGGSSGHAVQGGHAVGGGGGGGSSSDSAGTGSGGSAEGGIIVTYHVRGAAIIAKPITLAAQLTSGDITPVVRVSFLASDLVTVLHEVPGRFIGGSVTLDRTRLVRGSAQVKLLDEDGIYAPLGPDGLVWPYRVVRLERGALVQGKPSYAAVLTGFLDEPGASERSAAVSFTVWSRLRLMDRQFTAPLSFTVTTRLRTVVRTICELAGLGTDDALYDLHDGRATLSEERTFDTTENMLTALSKFCYDHGLDGPYDDGLGVTVLRPFVPPAEADLAWTFQPGTTSLLTGLDWSVRGAMPVFNRVVVEGRAPDTYPIVGEWRDLNPNSPTYNPPDGSGPIGDQLAPLYVSHDAHTQGQVNAIAERLGNEYALSDRPIAAKAVAIPFLRDRDVVRFVGADIDATVWLDQVTVPLDTSEMGMTARDARSLA